MKLLKVSLLAVLLTTLIIACQEYDDTTSDAIDPDMEIATLLADEHQISKNGRKDGKERSITVFRYHKGIVYFDTNTDDYKGYQELQETSITTVIKPGEYVYWYSGGGITDLEGIDFDSESQSYLDDLPEEVKPDRMWVLKVPENYNFTQELLKYDIVYESKDKEGYIRLDPKIQIQN